MSFLETIASYNYRPRSILARFQFGTVRFWHGSILAPCQNRTVFFNAIFFEKPADIVKMCAIQKNPPKKIFTLNGSFLTDCMRNIHTDIRTDIQTEE